MQQDSDLRPGLPDLPCACASARRLSRIITQLYAQELGRHLEPSQFALLTFLDKRAGSSQAALGKVMAIDKTTLSRNLRLMRANGWIESAAGNDGRERGFRLTRAGKALLVAATPGWKKAQARLCSAMSLQEWDAMWDSFRKITTAAQTALGEPT